MRIYLLTRPATLAAAAAVVAALGMPLTATTAMSAASAAPARTASRPLPPAVHFGAVRRAALPAGERYVCPAPSRPGQMECMSIVARTPAAANGDYGPSQLRSAYNIATAAAKKGKGVTVAIVDAFSDPNLNADLGRYRSHFHLSACTTGNHCLRIVNQSGKASPLPGPNANWATEESLDVDMVSAICPKCRILLVEAKSQATSDLGAAEQAAIKLGARFVSNSWSGGEFLGQDAFNQDFNHPGDVIDFSSGDLGAGPAYPTDLQYVTAVGGTTLKHAKNSRGWTETVWGANKAKAAGTGGGCSVLEAKPSWQRADAKASAGCLNRTENDVAAVGDPATGVLIFDSYQTRPAGFEEVGGTSAATPIITAIYALAGTPAHGTYPAEYPYLHAGRLFDVTAGVDGTCEGFRQYLCHGRRGYDGPTGLGTPDGTAAFTVSGHRLTLIDPGTQDAGASSGFSVLITGLNTTSTTPTWKATGLPAGLSISAIGGTSSGEIAGTLPATPGAFTVTVTARDGTATATTHFTIVITGSLTSASPGAGPVVLTSPGLCLDGGTDASGQPVTVQDCAGQSWTFASSGAPDDVQTVSVSGNCLTVANTPAPQDVSLAACDGSSDQDWQYLGFGELVSPFTNGCLAAPSMTAGTQVETARCASVTSQAWSLPAGPIKAGFGSLCLNNPSGTAVDVTSCGAADSQKFALLQDGTIASEAGQCLAASGRLAQTAVRLKTCDDTDPFQLWQVGPSGELVNVAFGMCLTDKNNGGVSTTVVQYDCYGNPGQVWGLN